MKKWLFLILFLFPVLTFARVEINEIMYDLEGSDTDREWLEIVNTGSETIDLSDWKFFEGNTNHGLTVVQGEALLLPGGYAVIVDNSSKFLADWPVFSGFILDSSFSLNNTGETLAFRDSNLADIDTAVYSSSLGAAGDGKSLQKINGSWQAAPPTPGVTNQAIIVVPPPPNEPPPVLLPPPPPPNQTTPPPPSNQVVQTPVLPTVNQIDPPQVVASVITKDIPENPVPAMIPQPTTVNVPVESLAKMNQELESLRLKVLAKEKTSLKPVEKKTAKPKTAESPKLESETETISSSTKVSLNSQGAEVVGAEPIFIPKKISWWRRVINWLFGR